MPMNDDIRDVLKFVLMAVLGALARAILEWLEAKKNPHAEHEGHRRDGGDRS